MHLPILISNFSAKIGLMAKSIDFIQDYLKPKFYKNHKVTLFGIRKYEFSNHPIHQFSLTTLFPI